MSRVPADPRERCPTHQVHRGLSGNLPPGGPGRPDRMVQEVTEVCGLPSASRGSPTRRGRSGTETMMACSSCRSTLFRARSLLLRSCLWCNLCCVVLDLFRGWLAACCSGVTHNECHPEMTRGCLRSCQRGSCLLARASMRQTSRVSSSERQRPPRGPGGRSGCRAWSRTRVPVCEEARYRLSVDRRALHPARLGQRTGQPSRCAWPRSTATQDAVAFVYGSRPHEGPSNRLVALDGPSPSQSRRTLCRAMCWALPLDWSDYLHGTSTGTHGVAAGLVCQAAGAVQSCPVRHLEQCRGSRRATPPKPPGAAGRCTARWRMRQAAAGLCF